MSRNDYYSFTNGVAIDMWYGDKISDCDKYDYSFYADGVKDHEMFAPYRGNLYCNGKMVGDWRANTLQDFEDILRAILKKVD